MKNIMKKVLFAVFVLSALVLSACSGNNGGADVVATLASVPIEFSGKTNPLGVDAAGKGADVFKTYCGTCHGPQGHGDGLAGESLNPKPKNLAALQVDVGDDYLYWRISTGKEGTAMIAWKGILTDEQIWQVVAFVRTLK
jgi:mono/diheme cytochrome c family protein